jgi:transmembrane sensor
VTVSEGMREEAQRWFGRMDGEDCTLAERRAFERWRAEPGHAEAFRELETAWDGMGQLQGHPSMQRMIDEARASAPGAPRYFRRPWALAAAASVAVCALAGIAFVAGRQYVPAKTYTTDFGQRSIVRLDDGSEVVLNSATRLQVRFANDRREFRLKTGEALFTVAQDPTRPFTVTAGDGEVTALGTRFQVRSEAEHVIVTLLEGRIAVDRESLRQRVELHPGEQVRFVEEKPEWLRRRVDPEVAASWTTGRLRFEDTPLSEVLEEVNRYTKIQIRLADSSLARRPINATLDMGNTRAVIAALELLLPLEATTQARNQIVLRKKY